MTTLYLAAAAFVLLHVLISGTPVRAVLVRRMGEGVYMGLFSLLSVATLVGLIFAFAGARLTPGDVTWWGAEGWRRHVSLTLVLLAFLIGVPGLLTPNPTSVKGEGALDRPDPARGIVRVTRHPFLMGVTLWAVGHMVSNGDLASLVMFGSFLVLGVAGPPSIDAKRARVLGAKWEAFRAQTSIVPFAAILAGRQKLSLAEIGWWRPAVAIVAFAAMIALHPHAFGANPLG